MQVENAQEKSMTKSLRSMSKPEREAAISRRLAGNTKGLGYWAAIDAQARQGEPLPSAAALVAAALVAAALVAAQGKRYADLDKAD